MKNVQDETDVTDLSISRPPKCILNTNNTNNMIAHMFKVIFADCWGFEAQQ